MRFVLSTAAMSLLPVAMARLCDGAENRLSAPASAGDLAVELIEQRQQIPLSAREWNALVARNETNSVFQTYEWFDAWWQTFGEPHDLFFLLVRKDRAVIGFGAMMLRHSSCGGRRLQFVGTGNADYQDFVLPDEKETALRSICNFLSSHASRWRSAWFSNIPGHSSTLPLLRRAGEESGLRFVEEAQVRCPALQLEADRGGAERLLKKYSLKRPLHWFSARGDVRFRNVSSLGEIQTLLPVFFDQHARRWKAVGRPSLFDAGNQRTFYLALAAALHSAGWLLFSVVEFNGQPIAFHFGFDYYGSLTWYKPSFEVQYAEHSPGLLLTRKIIEDGLARSKRELDFTIGDEAFKGRFANVSRFNVTLGVYHNLPSAWRAQGWRWLRRRLGWVRRQIVRSRFATTPAPAAKGAANPDTVDLTP
jgi:CelD/BcsL family acetyltransferase involved in cellulose biosynthesis